MAKEIDVKTLVYRADGPKQKEPTYQFTRKEFKQYPKPPGAHSNNVDSNNA